MLTTFWQTVGSKLADRWASVSVPALIFWLGGLATWTYHRGGLYTLAADTRWLDRQTTAVQVTLILTVLLTVAASAIVVDQLATPLLRLLEGYWPQWTGPLSRRLAARAADRAAKKASAWQRAYAAVQPPAAPTADQLATYARLERVRHRNPIGVGYFLPTPIGNILRAAERRPADKYGLDTVTVWPHLWLLLPDTTRQELRAARASLSTAVTVAAWGVLFCAFTPITPLAAPIGLAVATVAVTIVLPARAQAFGDLIEAAYDLYRTGLYQQLRWPLPANPGEEHVCGRKLTAYLRRGSDATTPTFTHPPSNSTLLGRFEYPPKPSGARPASRSINRRCSSGSWLPPARPSQPDSGMTSPARQAQANSGVRGVLLRVSAISYSVPAWRRKTCRPRDGPGPGRTAAARIGSARNASAARGHPDDLSGRAGLAADFTITATRYPGHHAHPTLRRRERPGAAQWPYVRTPDHRPELTAPT